MARFVKIRQWVASYKPSGQQFVLSNSSKNVTLDTSFTDACERLEQDGYYQGLRLSPSILSELVDFAHINPCYANRQPHLKFYLHNREKMEAELQRPIKIAGYFNTHESCPAFQALKQDPVILGLAANYLGHEPKYHRGEIAWSFPRPASGAEQLAAAQVLHCDINDYKTVKLFFYLTDVDAGCGPHVYLRGTHRGRRPLHQLLGQRCANIADEQLIETYGSDRVTEVHGPAGFGFAGDPYTFHKGVLPSRQPRLLLQLEFGICHYKTWYFS
ncbi:MAG: hypothetical protein AAF289_09440 [Cyanobacteria bacterium P01_A01_bin.135]